MAYFGLHHLETEEIYQEALAVILQGLTSDVLDHRGPRFTFRKVPMVMKPFQQPHPPLWYGMGHMAGAEWAATNRVHVICNNPRDLARPLFTRYREVWQRKHGDAVMPSLGISRHVTVAATDAEAEALARPNYAVWFANLTKLWRDFGAAPIRFATDFDEARERGIAIAGTPARVREEIEREIAASECTYFVCRLVFGNMSDAEATRTIDLFTAEVMPHLRARKPSHGGRRMTRAPCGPAVLVGLLVSPAFSQTVAARGGSQALRAGGYVIVVRHGATHADQADTDPLNLDNVAKQRQLNDKGRADARALGERLKAAGVPIGSVVLQPFLPRRRDRALDRRQGAAGHAGHHGGRTGRVAQREQPADRRAPAPVAAPAPEAGDQHADRDPQAQHSRRLRPRLVRDQGRRGVHLQTHRRRQVRAWSVACRSTSGRR